MVMSRAYGFLVIAFATVVSGTVWAQAQPAKPAAAPAGAADVKAASGDEQLAAVMLAGCRNEIELAIFAKSVLKSQEAKDFADKIMSDHQATCDKLEKLAGGHARPSRAANAPPAEQKAKFEIGKLKVEASTVRPRVEGESARAGSPLNWVSIHEEMADECLNAAKAELQRNDKRADEAFIGQQIAAHMKMIAQLKVFHKHASSDLRGVIDSSREVAEQHLKQAESLHGHAAASK